MSIDLRIPDMSDKELENLRANAARLVQSAIPKQRNEAERLLPIIDAALVERGAARAATLAANRRSKAKKAPAQSVDADS